MVTLLACSPSISGGASGSWGALHHQLSISPVASGVNLLKMSQGPPRRATKSEILEAFLSNLRQRCTVDLDVPGVVEGIRRHFSELPTRYALDVNISTLDVLNHKRLLDSARADPSAVSFQVRPVDVVVNSATPRGIAENRQTSFSNFGSMEAACQLNQQLSGFGVTPSRGMAARPAHNLPRPAFGSSPNLQALVLEAGERSDSQGQEGPDPQTAAFYEVTIASADQPKLLSRLSEALGDLNLNIAEAHAFNTTDRFTLDVFVVNGWSGTGVEDLEELLSQRLQELPAPGPQRQTSANLGSSSPQADAQDLPFLIDFDQRKSSETAAVAAPDDWELDPLEIKFQEKIASGAFGDLYKGSYCGQDVAIKILRNVQDDSAQYEEFAQEVSIMRKVRHKNVVQFIGACTRKPNLCIVVEYMPGGSVYDYMRKVGALKLSTVMKVAVEICRGMDYLHKRKIAHRDLKAANLLMDETGIVKIADFGVARVMDTAGVMTAETGTYRWMAPEVIEHKPYGEKADVFSFGIVLWELLTGRVPYSDMTPLQAAVGVVQQGLRPPIPSHIPPALAQVMHACWVRAPEERPSFEELKGQLEELWLSVRQEDMKRHNQGFLSKLRKPK